jgi:hypothetical protein
MTTPIHERRKANKGRWRVCEVCKRQTDGLSHFCRKHLLRRKLQGSVKVTRQLRHADYAVNIGLATKYLKKTPPPSHIIEAVLRFLQPPDPPKRYHDGGKGKALLFAEMSRWRDKRYQKKVTDHGGWSRKADYSPRGILAVLVAVVAYIDEREGRGFPGNAEHVAIVRALCRLWKRPRRMGGSKGEKYSTRINGTVLKLLAERWRQSTVLSVYVLQTARAVLAERSAAEVAKAKRPAAAPHTITPPKPLPLPARYPRPIYRGFADLPKIEQWNRLDKLWTERGM